MSTMYSAWVGLVTSLKGISLEGGGVVSAIPSKLLICRFNAQTLTAQGMYDLNQTAFWTTAASLSGILLDEFGNIITTVNLSHVSGSNGNFIGTFGGSTFAPPVGRGYTIVFKGASDWGNAFDLSVRAEVVATLKFFGTGIAPVLPP